MDRTGKEGKGVEGEGRKAIAIEWAIDHWLIRIAQPIHPKGSFSVIPNKNWKPGSKFPPYILKESDNIRSQRNSLRRLLIKEWGDRPMITGPVEVYINFTFVRSKTNSDPFPYAKGDGDKLERQIFDCLAGNKKQPGPVLLNDNLIVDQGCKKRWGECNEALVSIWPIGELA